MRQNHKPPKNFQRGIVIFSLFILINFLIGCSNTESTNTITPPPRATSVIPTFQKVDNGISQTKETNVELGEKIKHQKTIINNQQQQIEKALAQAEKIREQLKQKDTTDVNVMDLIDSLNSIQTRNLFLEKENSELEKVKNRQQEYLEKLEANSKETLDKLIEREKETQQLRTIVVALNKRVQQVDKIERELQNAKEEAAKANVYKHWVIGIVSVVVAWIVLKNVLMVYFPTTRFRL